MSDESINVFSRCLFSTIMMGSSPFLSFFVWRVFPSFLPFHITKTFLPCSYCMYSSGWMGRGCWRGCLQHGGTSSLSLRMAPVLISSIPKRQVWRTASPKPPHHAGMPVAVGRRREVRLCVAALESRLSHHGSCHYATGMATPRRAMHSGRGDMFHLPIDKAWRHSRRNPAAGIVRGLTHSSQSTQPEGGQLRIKAAQQHAMGLSTGTSTLVPPVRTSWSYVMGSLERSASLVSKCLEESHENRAGDGYRNGGPLSLAAQQHQAQFCYELRCRVPLLEDGLAEASLSDLVRWLALLRQTHVFPVDGDRHSHAYAAAVAATQPRSMSTESSRVVALEVDTERDERRGGLLPPLPMVDARVFQLHQYVLAMGEEHFASMQRGTTTAEDCCQGLLPPSDAPAALKVHDTTMPGPTHSPQLDTDEATRGGRSWAYNRSGSEAMRPHRRHVKRLNELMTQWKENMEWVQCCQRHFVSSVQPSS